jgi:hypothetical protein
MSVLSESIGKKFNLLTIIGIGSLSGKVIVRCDCAWGKNAFLNFPSR